MAVRLLFCRCCVGAGRHSKSCFSFIFDGLFVVVDAVELATIVAEGAQVETIRNLADERALVLGWLHSCATVRT